MTPTAPDPADSLPWRFLRAIIRAELRRALRQVLMAHETGTGTARRRWLGPEIADLAAGIEPQAAALRPLARLGDLPGIGNRLMVELAVYTAAAYRAALDSGIEPAEARALIADAGWLVYARMLRLASLPFRAVSRDPGFRLRGTIRSLLRFPFHAPGAPGYAADVRVEGGDMFTRFTNCPPQSFVRALVALDDRGDLDAFRDSWCSYDFPGADLIAGDRQRGHYSRPRTLSQGDPVCDMCWRAIAEPSQLQPGAANHGHAETPGRKTS